MGVVNLRPFLFSRMRMNNKNMKILVIGNGFDLAHYLPTSYNHFMGVMAAIEKLPKQIDSDLFDGVLFGDLFGELIKQEKQEDKKDWYFFDRMKQLYTVENMKFDRQVVDSFKRMLNENTWYAYFRQHLAEIETWIDFETKIGEALEVFDSVNGKFYEKKIERGSDFEPLNHHTSTKSYIYLGDKHTRCSKVFGILKEDIADEESYSSRFSDRYLDSRYKELKFDLVLADIQSSLSQFAIIFDLYLSIIISAFIPRRTFIDPDKTFQGQKLLYSFNYTQTFKKLYTGYQADIGVEYLHGEAGNKDKKLVLGVSKLSTDGLKKHKAYGFVKYHQKLFNNTDYQFLKENRAVQEVIKTFNPNSSLSESVNITIWGHSLDISDEDYIKEIFSFNDSNAPRGCVVVTILFHSDSSRFSILANLLHILEKEVVELWMKKKWLQFKLAPDIYELNRLDSPTALEHV